jgi:hypothetical protein
MCFYNFRYGKITVFEICNEDNPEICVDNWDREYKCWPDGHCGEGMVYSLQVLAY